MIDLAAAYDRMTEILTARGVDAATTHYSINVEVVHYRGARRGVHVNAYAAPSPGGSILAYQRPTVDDALATFDRMLGEALAAPPAPITALTVHVPDAAPAAAPSVDDDQPF